MVCCTASGCIIFGLGGFVGAGWAGGPAAGAGALCIAFSFVHFGVGFIWEDRCSAVSSLLVILPAILPIVTNFLRRVRYLKFCFRFYLMSFYFWLL